MRPPPSPEFRADRRLAASLVAGVIITRTTDHPLVAVMLIAAALAVVWGWP